MEKTIQDFLFDPTVSKISTIIIGVALIWLLIKALQRSLFSRIKDNDNRYRAKKISNFTGYF